MKNVLPILLLALSCVSCRTDYVSGQLDEAERMMDESHPDSALALLRSLRKESVRGKEVQARLALATAKARIYLRNLALGQAEEAVDEGVHWAKRNTSDRENLLLDKAGEFPLGALDTMSWAQLQHLLGHDAIAWEALEPYRPKDGIQRVSYWLVRSEMEKSLGKDDEAYRSLHQYSVALEELHLRSLDRKSVV